MIHPQSNWYSVQRQIRVILLICLFTFIPRIYAFQSEHPLSGRRIAPVMGVGGADWLDRSERESEENPDGALDAIGIKPGMVVGDVGAGTGYMSLKMAKRVGPTGKVYSEDVQPEMLRRLRANAVDAKLTNIQTVLGGEADPKLPPNSLDLILM